jgi:hypothetical protein
VWLSVFGCLLLLALLGVPNFCFWVVLFASFFVLQFDDTL